MKKLILVSLAVLLVVVGCNKDAPKQVGGAVKDAVSAMGSAGSGGDGKEIVIRYMNALKSDDTDELNKVSYDIFNHKHHHSVCNGIAQGDPQVLRDEKIKRCMDDIKREADATNKRRHLPKATSVQYLETKQRSDGAYEHFFKVTFADKKDALKDRPNSKSVVADLVWVPKDKYGPYLQTMEYQHLEDF